MNRKCKCKQFFRCKTFFRLEMDGMIGALFVIVIEYDIFLYFVSSNKIVK